VVAGKRRRLKIEDVVGRIPAPSASYVCKQCKDRGEYTVQKVRESTGEPYLELKTCLKCRRGRKLDARRRRPSDDEPEAQTSMLGIGDGE
jgi:hypothetical protein